MEKQYKLRNGPGPAEFRQKLKIVMMLVCLALSVLTVRLWHLQVIKGDELKQRSENNAVRFRKIQPLRGLVMDRNGRVIADNRPAFDVLYMPTKGVNPESLIQKIKDIYKKMYNALITMGCNDRKTAVCLLSYAIEYESIKAYFNVNPDIINKK